MSDDLNVGTIIREHIKLATQVQADLPGQIAGVANLLVGALKKGGTVFWCGNGGSAADSQHYAAELVGRFARERAAIASVALTTDSSIITAIGNDYGFADIFSRQVEALVRPGDVLVGISTSGHSENVIRAIRVAKAKKAIAVGLLGRDGGKLKTECDHAIVVPSHATARIQEMHLMIGHILCDLVENAWA